MRSFVYAFLLGALMSPALAATDEPPRRVYEYVDEAGARRFTSDPRVAAAQAPDLPAPSEEESLAAQDGEAVAESLTQFLAAYAAPGVARAVASIRIDVRAPDAADRETLRRAAEQVEVLATTDPTPGSLGFQAIGAELARLLFTPLRSIYPAAHLIVTVHDGVHTVARADWDPAQPEPAIRMR